MFNSKVEEEIGYKGVHDQTCHLEANAHDGGKTALEQLLTLL